MKVEVIDRLIAEDMARQGKSMEEILKCIPKKRHKEFKRNITNKKTWFQRLMAHITT